MPKEDERKKEIKLRSCEDIASDCLLVYSEIEYKRIKKALYVERNRSNRFHEALVKIYRNEESYIGYLDNGLTAILNQAQIIAKKALEDDSNSAKGDQYGK